MTDMTKKPDPGGAVFAAGPAVTPAAALLTWLDAQQHDGEPRLLRLPIVLTRDDGGFSNRAVKIGAAADAVAIFANDAALGISLEQRARSLCKTGPTCAVRIEGYWRGKQDGDYTVDVMKVLDVISADALAAAHAEVEGASGN